MMVSFVFRVWDQSQDGMVVDCIHSKAANFLDKRGQINVRADHQREGSEDTY